MPESLLSDTVTVNSILVTVFFESAIDLFIVTVFMNISVFHDIQTRQCAI